LKRHRGLKEKEGPSAGKSGRNRGARTPLLAKTITPPCGHGNSQPTLGSGDGTNVRVDKKSARRRRRARTKATSSNPVFNREKLKGGVATISRRKRRKRGGGRTKGRVPTKPESSAIGDKVQLTGPLSVVGGGGKKPGVLSDGFSQTD